MLKSAVLLEANADLQLGNIDGDRWLEILAHVTESERACAAVWTPAQTESVTYYGDIKNDCFSPLLIRSLDANRSLLDLSGVMLLDEAAILGTLPDDAQAMLKNPRNLYGLIDTDPAISLLLLHREPAQPEWSDENRNHFRMMLPALRKGHTLYKRLRVYDNFLSIANEAINSFTMGVIALSPDGEILKANELAQVLFEGGDDFSDRNNQLRIGNALVHRQTYEKLQQVSRMPASTLRSFIWNRSFRSETGAGSYQICMQAFPNEDWHQVSTPHDRHIMLTIQSPEMNITPTPDLLKEFYDLTNAQARLVCAMLEGRGTAQAARHLNISVNTARSHLRTIYAKLGISSSTELISLLSATLVKYVPHLHLASSQLKQ